MFSHHALFTGLSPSSYLLTLLRQGHCMHLLLRLPPGANVVLRCRFGERHCRWKRDPFHYFFNRI